MNNIITMDSFGADCPINWEEIADYLNSVIEEENLDDSEVEQLWEEYCRANIEDCPKPKFETIKELRNNYDGDFAMSDVEKVKEYFDMDKKIWFSQEDIDFNKEIKACKDLYECADVLNYYSDTVLNGSRFEVVEI